MSTVSGGRESLEDWVPQEDLREFFRLEQSLGRLEQDPTCRRAASTLFWQLYHGLHEVQDRLTLLNRIHELYRGRREHFWNTSQQEEDHPLSDLAFVQLHLVTILLRAIRSGVWGSPELSDEIIKVGKNAFVILPYDDYAGALISARRLCEHLYDKGIDWQTATSSPSTAESATAEPSEQGKQSLSAVTAMVYAEAFRRDRESDSHEAALHHFSIAANMWAASESGLQGELSLIEAADSFERIRAARSKVASWEAVMEQCRLISESLDSESADLDGDIEIMDSKGFPCPAIAYWEHAATFAQGELSPSEFQLVLAKMKNDSHVERFQRDYFEDVWAQLEEQTQRALVSMEIAWYDAPKLSGRRSSAVNELRLAFQYELNWLFSEPLRSAADTILKDPSLRKELGLYERASVGSLGLRDAQILLQSAGMADRLSSLSLRTSLNELKLNQNDREFLLRTLPAYLGTLAGVRNPPEHGLEPQRLAKEISRLRRQALGIGGVGYLCRWIDVKMFIRQRQRG